VVEVDDVVSRKRPLRAPQDEMKEEPGAQEAAAVFESGGRLALAPPPPCYASGGSTGLAQTVDPGPVVRATTARPPPPPVPPHASSPPLDPTIDTPLVPGLQDTPDDRDAPFLPDLLPPPGESVAPPRKMDGDANPCEDAPDGDGSDADGSSISLGDGMDVDTPLPPRPWDTASWAPDATSLSFPLPDGAAAGECGSSAPAPATPFGMSAVGPPWTAASLRPPPLDAATPPGAPWVAGAASNGSGRTSGDAASAVARHLGAAAAGGARVGLALGAAALGALGAPVLGAAGAAPPAPAWALPGPVALRGTDRGIVAARAWAGPGAVGVGGGDASGGGWASGGVCLWELPWPDRDGLVPSVRSPVPPPLPRPLPSAIPPEVGAPSCVAWRPRSARDLAVGGTRGVALVSGAVAGAGGPTTTVISSPSRPFQPPPGGPGGGVGVLAWSPCGRLLAAHLRPDARGRGGGVVVWAAASGRVRRVAEADGEGGVLEAAAGVVRSVTGGGPEMRDAGASEPISSGGKGGSWGALRGLASATLGLAAAAGAVGGHAIRAGAAAVLGAAGAPELGPGPSPLLVFSPDGGRLAHASGRTHSFCVTETEGWTSRRWILPSAAGRVSGLAWGLGPGGAATGGPLLASTAGTVHPAQVAFLAPPPSFRAQLAPAPLAHLDPAAAAGDGPDDDDDAAAAASGGPWAADGAPAALAWSPCGRRLAVLPGPGHAREGDVGMWATRPGALLDAAFIGWVDAGAGGDPPVALAWWGGKARQGGRGGRGEEALGPPSALLAMTRASGTVGLLPVWT